jgi:hypothetical protein
MCPVSKYCAVVDPSTTVVVVVAVVVVVVARVERWRRHPTKDLVVFLEKRIERPLLAATVAEVAAVGVVVVDHSCPWW